MTSITIMISDKDIPNQYGTYVVDDNGSIATGRITAESREDAVKLLENALGLTVQPYDGAPSEEVRPAVPGPGLCNGDDDYDEDDDEDYESSDYDDDDEDPDYDDEYDDDYDDDDYYVPEPPHVFLTLSGLKHGLLEDPSRPYKNHEIVFYYKAANNRRNALQVRLDDGDDNDDYRFMVVTSSGVKRPIMFDALTPFEGVPSKSNEDPIVVKYYLNPEDLDKYEIPGDDDTPFGAGSDDEGNDAPKDWDAPSDEDASEADDDQEDGVESDDGMVVGRYTQLYLF